MTDESPTPDMTCVACLTEIGTTLTCLVDRRPGVTPYTQDLPAEEYGLAVPEAMPALCRICGVARGGLHHAGCTIAGCLTHDYEQRITCGCDDDLYEEYERRDL